MGKYTKQVWISSPPEDVVDAIDTPDTWRIIVPSMQDAETIEKEEGGYRLEFTYKLGGIKIKRAIETNGSEKADDEEEAWNDPDAPEQRTFDLSGMITGRYSFEISKQGTGTRVKFDTQYKFSNRVLDRITRQFASQYLTRQFDSLLANLKHYIEMEDADLESGVIEPQGEFAEA